MDDFKTQQLRRLRNARYYEKKKASRLAAAQKLENAAASLYSVPVEPSLDVQVSMGCFMPDSLSSVDSERWQRAQDDSLSLDQRFAASAAYWTDTGGIVKAAHTTC